MSDKPAAAAPTASSSWLFPFAERKPAPTEEALAAMSREQLEAAQNELLFGNHLCTLLGTGAAIAASKFLATKQQRYASLFAFGGFGALADLYLGYKQAAPYRLSLEALTKAEERAALAAEAVKGGKRAGASASLSVTDFRPVGGSVSGEGPPLRR